MIPEWSTSAKSSMDVLFESYNDAHFYIEDEDQRNLYSVIISKYLPDVHYKQVFPLGGKPAVLKHAADRASARVLSKPQVYIVDKDFDDLLNIRVIDDHLFYLEKYCIENYLVDQGAVKKLVIEFSPRIDIDDRFDSSEFDNFLKSEMQLCLRLFKTFCAAQKLGSDVRNCSYSPERFGSNNTNPSLDASQVDRYRSEVVGSFLRSGVLVDSSGFDEVEDAISHEFLDGDQHVSGKFLLKLVILYLRSRRLIGNLDYDVAVYSLARNCPMNGMKSFWMRVNAYLIGLRVQAKLVQ